MNYYPKRPVKSFQDLEVYQKTLGVCVAVVKRIISQGVALPLQGDALKNRLADLAMSLPAKIAAAHSFRFADQVKAINTLEEIMLGYNLLVVYLEQYRDIYNGTRDGRSKDQGNVGIGTIETEFFEEQIKTLLTCRFKVLHLQMSWKKFTPFEKKKI